MISFTIQGQPPRKSNGRRIVRNGDHVRVIKSADALAWVKSALMQIPPEARQGIGSLEHPLRATFHIRYETRRPDLSVELILDVLEEAGVIANDRYVYETHAYKWFSKDHPGVFVQLEVME